LAIFKNRFSSEELVQIFVTCSFPVHVWAIPNMLQDVPAWMIYYDANDLLGIVSYTLALMLFESIFTFIVIFSLGMLIPNKWVRESTVSFCFVLVVEFTTLAIIYHYLSRNYVYYRRLYIVIAVLTAILLAFILSRIKKLKTIISRIINLLSPLTFLYITIDIFASLVVIVRNL